MSAALIVRRRALEFVVAVSVAVVNFAVQAGEPHRNVVVIFADDMGFDLSCMGTPGIETPNLDRMVAAGTLFTRAYAADSVCSPSRGALLTGTFSNWNGLDRLTANGGLKFPSIAVKPSKPETFRSALREDVPTLVEVLSMHGFYQAITQKTHVQPMWKFPFSRGFDYHNKPEQYDRLIDQVKTGAEGRPFFLLANVSPPHLPFDAHLEPNGLVDEAGRPKNVDPDEIGVPAYLPDTPAIRADLARYFACVELADSCVGAVMDGLERNGLLESTLVVFSSDHGIAYHRGKVSAYPAGLHVPLIFQGPGVAAGKRSAAPVSLVDVMPTVLSYLDIQTPETVQGTSLWPILDGSAGKLAGRPTIFGMTNEHFLGRMVTDGQFYYVRNLTQPRGSWDNPPMNADLWQEKPWGNKSFAATVAAKNESPLAYELLRQLVEGDLPEEELYDLEADPWATENLAADPEQAEILQRLRDEMSKWREITDDETYLQTRTSPK